MRAWRMPRVLSDNIALTTGQVLHFNPKTEQFKEESANALVKRKYRDHWATPKNV